jgi:NAD(P)-dependent dehydrogenase (short-subunit alcohol dehydrogenase family)
MNGDRLRLEGRGIVITGASQGLGKAIAKTCVAEGAHVLICARDKERLDSVRNDLAQLARKKQKVAAFAADVSQVDAANEIMDYAADQLPGLSGLVNNAGVYGPMGLLEEINITDWVRALQINLMGTVLPCRAALPIFRKQGYGKIVNLSGGGATAPMPRFSAYAASKAAVVRFTETLAEETREAHIDVNAIAPGALNTRLLDEVLAAEPLVVGQAFYDRARAQKEKGGVPLEKGAALTAYLLSSESDGITGRLISAIWDPWESLHQRRDELNRTDVYTLRRIVPKDRGLDWE